MRLDNGVASASNPTMFGAGSNFALIMKRSHPLDSFSSFLTIANWGTESFGRTQGAGFVRVGSGRCPPANLLPGNLRASSRLGKGRNHSYRDGEQKPIVSQKVLLESSLPPMPIESVCFWIHRWSWFQLVFTFRRGKRPPCGMQPFFIRPIRDEWFEPQKCFLSGFRRVSVNLFGLERLDEAKGYGIIEWLPHADSYGLQSHGFSDGQCHPNRHIARLGRSGEPACLSTLSAIGVSMPVSRR